MENRFLKRLQTGLSDLQKNPLNTEVAEIPRSSFEVFVRIFRNGLPLEIQETLPSHSLADKNYLRLLAFQVDSVLQKPIEAEKILSNMPPLESLNLAFEKARGRQAAVMTQHQDWKTSFEQRIKQYNLDLISRLDLQLQKEFPSLTQNPDKRKILVSDMAQTIQDQGLPAIKGDFQPQAREIVEKVVQTTIKRYAAELEEAPTEERISAVSEIIAKDQADSAFAIRRGQIRAETSPTENSTYKVSAAVETSVIANLPPELAQNEEVVNTILGEIEMQIHQGPQDVSQIVQNVLSRKNVQTKIAAAKIAFSAEAQQNFLNAVPEEIGPIINEIATSPQFAQTPFAGSGASFAPGGGAPGGGIPPPGASGLYSTSSIPEGSIEDIFFSSGQPLHLFTALASPHSGENLFNWLITGGPIKSAIGFIYDSTPGTPHLDYFKVGVGLMFQTRRQLEQTMMNLQPPERLVPLPAGQGYEHNRELQEVKDRLSFVNQQIDALRKIPGFDKFYNFYYGGWGRLLHLLDSLQLWSINKNIFAGLGVSGVVKTLSWTVQYGPAGFAYGVQQLPVQFGLLALKWGMSKTGLYKVVGLPGSRHYVFAPTYELGLWAKKLIYKKVLQPLKIGIGKGLIGLGKKLKIPGLVSFGRKIIGGLVGKLLAALMKFLGFLGLAWGLVKALWNKIIKPGVLFLLYLLLTHGLWAGAGALGGLLLGLPFAAKAFALTFGFFSPFITPFLAWIPASVAFVATEVVFLVFGASAGVLLHGLWDGFAANWTAAAANFSLTKAALGISGYAFPVLATTFSIISGVVLFENFWLSSAAWIPTQLPQVQSAYFDVKKAAVFSGELEKPIKYRLLVNIKADKIDKKLINIKISDTTNSSCANQPPTIAERNFADKIPSNITFTTPLSITYELPTDSSFNDCLITNTAAVTADVENGPAGEQSFYTASVTIGNPPVDLPSGWPVATGCLTQGPNGAESHSGDQAIDISGQTGEAILGTEIFATHKGTVSLAFRNHAIFGNYIIVDGSGNKSGFQTLYAHLQTVAVSRGQSINKGTKIGTVGNTGRSTAPHLHYEFRGLKMGAPYVPVSIPACVGREVCKICF